LSLFIEGKDLADSHLLHESGNISIDEIDVAGFIITKSSFRQGLIGYLSLLTLYSTRAK